MYSRQDKHLLTASSKGPTSCTIHFYQWVSNNRVSLWPVSELNSGMKEVLSEVGNQELKRARKGDLGYTKFLTSGSKLHSVSSNMFLFSDHQQG